MSTGPNNMAPEYIIGFGEPDWQSHLGGGFHGPESADAITYNWLSGEKAWCVLPPLSPEADYVIRLEAAPMAPFQSDVQLIRVVAGEQELRWVTSRQQVLATRDLSLRLSPSSVTNKPSGPEANLRVSCEVLPSPRLNISINDLPAARLDYDTRQCMQIRDFPLSRDLLGPSAVMFFEPNVAFEPSDLADSTDDRSLSFRLFRMMLYRLG